MDRDLKYVARTVRGGVRYEMVKPSMIARSPVIGQYAGHHSAAPVGKSVWLKHAGSSTLRSTL